MTLAKYKRYTARVVVVTIWVTVPLLLAAIPVTWSRSNRQTIWPLSYHFGVHHAIACVEMLIVWIVVGAVLLIWSLFMMHELMKRAGWAKG